MKAPIGVTTNRLFSEWAVVFQSAACVSTLLDRLCHRDEIDHARDDDDDERGAGCHLRLHIGVKRHVRSVFGTMLFLD